MPHDFHDPDAEIGFLAALQLNPALVWSAAPQLRADMFTAERGEIFTTLVTAAQAAQADQVLSTLIEGTPANDPLAAATAIIVAAKGRVMDAELERLGKALNRAQAGGTPIDDVLRIFADAVAKAQQLGTASAGALIPTTDLLAAIVADAQARAERRATTGDSIMGLPTGFGRLDDLLNGLEPGLLILAGRPGMGKTTLANLIAANVAATGVPVLYVSYENSRDNLILKHLCRLSGISETQVRRGLADPVVLGVQARSFGAKAATLYYTEATAGTTVDTIRAQGRQLRQRHNSDTMLVIVDYLQKMAPTAGFDGLRENVGAIAAQLRDLSRDLKAPVLALASLNRAGYEEGKTPSMANLKEIGDIEYGADVVMLLSEGKGDGPPMGNGRPVTLRIAKNRGGEAGTDVALVFRPSTGDFREQAPFSMVGANGARR
jgi:replicative DNA helicase